MESEIKRPELDEPKFFKEPYDYRNIEDAGHYRGVGEAGKTATSRQSSSLNAMPDQSKSMYVPRDHKG